MPATKTRGRKASAFTAAEKPAETIVSFKGFDKDLACRGHKYEIGKTYELKGKIAACSYGFHACENPFDVWSYYGPVDGNRFAVVEQAGDISRHSQDSKIASAKITVTAELALPDFINRAVDWIIERAKSAATGDLTDKGQDDAQIGSSGNGAQIGSSGYGARIGSSGNGARIGSSGYGARIEASGEMAVIASAGRRATVKGAAGTWMSVAEFNDDGDCIGFATGCAGRNGVPADTWLRAQGGKLVAA